ncbi:NAD(P)-binding domain [Phytophthora cactorum]|nr:NAD(P)-binding domain [Phytophthora cactorum]
MRRMITWSSHAKQRVGFIGLGQMGGRMADNSANTATSVVCATPQVDQGAKAAANAREVAEQCDTIITMLPSTATVECVYLGEDGVHEALRSEHLLLDSSTIDPIFTKKLSKELHDRGATSWTPQCLAAWRLMRKDLGLASSCAMSAEVSAPLTNSVLQLFNMMDFAYILPFLKGGNSDHH